MLILVATALAAPPQFKVNLEGGIYAGYALTSDNDLVPAGPEIGGRIGIAMREFDVEFSWTRAAGETRWSPFDFVATTPAIAVLFHPDPTRRFDAFAGAGAGWRHVAIDDEFTGWKASEGALGVQSRPIMDTFLFGDIGLTVWTVGPVHIRADARVGVTIGDEPARQGGHLSGLYEAQLGIDLRDEGPPDRDRDGVPNRTDQCNDSLEDLDGFDDKDGCIDPDDDRDGVSDVMDRCKNSPEDYDKFEDADGCPDPNNDQDGLSDVNDACPEDPETTNGYVDNDGCPDTVPGDLAAAIYEQRGFAFDGTNLTSEADPSLNALLVAMTAYPAIKIRIESNTDGDEPTEVMRKWTERHAKAIEGWLVARGIPEERIVPIGNGNVGVLRGDHSPETIASHRKVNIRLAD